MAFPSDKELRRVRKLLENVEGTRIVGDEGTKVEKFKFAICQKFIAFFIESELTQKEFSILLGIDEALVSKLLRCRIENFTSDRLLKLLEVIYPDYTIQLAS
jgi:predicted XRE-type DNA-binding protein